MLPKVQAVSETLEVVGNAEAVNQVKLVARVPGYLEQIHFQDGAIVKKGDLLFTIQQDQYKEQLQQAQAQLQAATVARDHAKLEVGRYTALLKQHATSQVEVDHWVFEEQTAEANILAAQAQVAIAELNLGYTEVRAPFDGQMGRHLIDIGNMVGGTAQSAGARRRSPSSTRSMSSPTSARSRRSQIRANLDQRRLTLEEMHKVPIEAALSDETGFPHKGTLAICRAADRRRDRHALSARHHGESGPHAAARRVRQGAPADGQGHEERPARPADRACRKTRAGAIVLVVNAGNVIEKRYVQLGQTVGALRQVDQRARPQRPRRRRRTLARVARHDGHAQNDHAPRIRTSNRRSKPMMSKFFIEHPVLANVLAIVLVVIGAVSLYRLPVSEYPNVVPPTVQVTASYPGASAQTVLNTVALPIENQVNGVDKHALHEVDQRAGRHLHPDRHLRDRHRSEHRPGAGAEPRPARAGLAARAGPGAGRQRPEEEHRDPPVRHAAIRPTTNMTRSS